MKGEIGLVKEKGRAGRGRGGVWKKVLEGRKETLTNAKGVASPSYLHRRGEFGLIVAVRGSRRKRRGKLL